MINDESHLDGNAIGGLLQELFDREMTDQLGCCGNCGAISRLGPLSSTLMLPAASLLSSVRKRVAGGGWSAHHRSSNHSIAAIDRPSRCRDVTSGSLRHP
ncbi:MAG: DUF6510 family protein [Acidimicrobiia bacterium]